jgi:acyl carrier protein
MTLPAFPSGGRRSVSIDWLVMGVESGIDEAVRDLVRSRASLAQERSDLPDDLRLGAGGLGLDSIALVELLLDCEKRFGVPRVAELLAGPPLTLGHLVAHVRSASGQV